jgi:Gas vesicle protein
MRSGLPKARTNRAAPRGAGARQRRVSLCEVLDRVLNKGAVVVGRVVISIAGVDLVYVGLNLIVASVETIRLSQMERDAPRLAAAGAAGNRGAES